MRCAFALQTLEYTAVFGRPLFSLARRQAELAETWFDKSAAALPVDLSDMQAIGGTTYADVAVTLRLPRLRGSLEVRVDRIHGALRRRSAAGGSGSGNGRSRYVHRGGQRSLSRCSSGIHLGCRSFAGWTCGGDKHGVETLLASRQQVQFDPLAVGAEIVRFAVRGQLTNESEAWSLAFGLEPSLLPGYDLYLICQATYEAGSPYGSVEARWAHVREAGPKVLHQFGFEVS